MSESSLSSRTHYQMEISNIWELLGVLVLIGAVVVGLGLAAFMCWFNCMYRRRESDVNYEERAETPIKVEAKEAPTAPQYAQLRQEECDKRTRRDTL